jgi:hypothetical protein
MWVCNKHVLSENKVPSDMRRRRGQNIALSLQP